MSFVYVLTHFYLIRECLILICHIKIEYKIKLNIFSQKMKIIEYIYMFLIIKYIFCNANSLNLYEIYRNYLKII